MNMPLATENQRRKAANDLIREGRRAVVKARKLLSIIAEEISNRDNRTCLLLPPRNFGSEIDAVFDCVRNATLAGEEGEEFKNRLSAVARSLRTQRKGNREYFTGRRGIVFKSPGKAGARHGLAPDWKSPGGHDASCVIRGRLRFGASYDPEFFTTTATFPTPGAGISRAATAPSAYPASEPTRMSHRTTTSDENNGPQAYSPGPLFSRCSG